MIAMAKLSCTTTLAVQAAALGLLALLPVLFTSHYLVGVLTVAAIYGIWCVSWDFMSGLTGRENFGHSLFIGVGAYTAGFLNTTWGLSPWISLPMAMLLAPRDTSRRIAGAGRLTNTAVASSATSHAL